MVARFQHRWVLLALCIALAAVLPFLAGAGDRDGLADKEVRISDHFDGNVYFNPWSDPVPPGAPGGSKSRWIMRWIFGAEWPDWPKAEDLPPAAPPAQRVAVGSLRVTPVGHSTFLIQMDGLNILTDPIWSERASPVSWVGPKRYKKPGIRFEDLPPIDAVLISHNHYDHLDLPTLKRLAEKGVPRALVPLGDRDLVLGEGIPSVDEMDWWESARIGPDITVTLVPARHFSARSLWDRNKTLWGGFVVSGPSGNVYYSGDTGYGPHFKEIARRFSPIKMALLPISPFRPEQESGLSAIGSMVHTGPEEAVQAHIDLGAEVSIAAHYQVFQLGPDRYFDAVKGLAAALEKHDLQPDAFFALSPGRTLERTTGVSGLAAAEKSRRLTSATKEPRDGRTDHSGRAAVLSHLVPPQNHFDTVRQSAR